MWSDKNLTIEQVQDELVVCESSVNPLTEEYKITVPAGARVIKGITEKQIIKNSASEIVKVRVGRFKKCSKFYGDNYYEDDDN